VSELIQFEGRTVAVIAPEDLEDLEAELILLRTELAEREKEVAHLRSTLTGRPSAELHEAALAEKDAEIERLKDAGVGYSQQTVDALQADIKRLAFWEDESLRLSNEIVAERGDKAELQETYRAKNVALRDELDRTYGLLNAERQRAEEFRGQLEFAVTALNKERQRSRLPEALVNRLRSLNIMCSWDWIDQLRDDILTAVEGAKP